MNPSSLLLIIGKPELTNHGFLDKMVAHLGLRTHELLYEEKGNIIAEILSEECYGEVANHSQRIITLIQCNNFWGFLNL